MHLIPLARMQLSQARPQEDQVLGTPATPHTQLSQAQSHNRLPKHSKP